MSNTKKERKEPERDIYARARSRHAGILEACVCTRARTHTRTHTHTHTHTHTQDPGTDGLFIFGPLPLMKGCGPTTYTSQCTPVMYVKQTTDSLATQSPMYRT